MLTQPLLEKLSQPSFPLSAPPSKTSSKIPSTRSCRLKSGWLTGRYRDHPQNQPPLAPPHPVRPFPSPGHHRRPRPVCGARPQTSPGSRTCPERLGPPPLNVLVLGATGTGKTYLSCALGRAACEAEFNVRYLRTSRLLQSLELAQADGSYPQLLRSLARSNLLIFDDWLRDPLSRSQAKDLLEILDDRYGRTATLVATQVPVNEWHARIPDPTLADRSSTASFTMPIG